ncbi:pseudouridine synthase [Parathalassolituus penaei]|uniref:Pseudouridine synthase n=1 Tax=Parathalassolituus penaei TaxID=2997323 RepID=A0A9X3EFM1_9GAMM|nr:16S rRNA pseudouridine(516) synthase [Parathalassolituus penaei]MCY0966657.1 16S rRNA pseudouridine(516) synthase [Parathalassolituus penaei]
MAYSSTRLDRFLAAHLQCSRKTIRAVLAAGRVVLDGELARDPDKVVGPFTRVELDGECLQGRRPLYLMLHKPVGVVCATEDEQHRTVLDLIRAHPEDLTASELDDLHIVGRLDLNTSGLVLLTNDGEWSRRLMSPEHKVAKVYEVRLANPLSPEYVTAFAEGMYFPYEDITTQPAQLEILGERQARVTLTEGKYHQIKRMFGRFRNPVVALHRHSVGEWKLNSSLQAGQWRRIFPAHN